MPRHCHSNRCKKHEKLKPFGANLTLNTGDRVMGMKHHLREYDGETFTRCSRDVDYCLSQIEKGVKDWQLQIYGPQLL